MNKILKYEVCQISVPDLVEEVLLNKPKIVWLIDRENAGLIDKPPFWRDDQIWVESYNINKKNLAKGRFIAAASTKKNAADLLISMVVFGLLSQT